MITIGIHIGTLTGPILVGAAGERDAALTAEGILYALKPADLPVHIRVECHDRKLSDRLMDYLIDLQGDLCVSRPPCEHRQTSKS